MTQPKDPTPAEASPAPPGSLGRRARSFRVNLGALRIFVDEIGELADQRDKTVIQEFVESLRPIMGEEFGRITAEVNESRQPPAPVSASTGPHHEQTNSTPPSAPADVEESQAERTMKAVFDDPLKRRAFLRAINTVSRKHPGQGAILRRGAVVSLMTHVEDLVADLVHAFYELYPAALPAEERSLTLTELRNLGSIDEAQSYLVAQEVDSVLRESLERQFEYFAKRPKVNLPLVAPYQDRINEVDQRRNLYVHNRGLVNRRYLERVHPDLVKLFGAEEGKALKLEDDYLTSAIDAAFLAGVALSQLCWRKWQPAFIAKADSELIEAIYDELQSERYLLVIDLTQFAESLTLADDENRKIIIVNHAIALRDTNRRDELNALLAATDWTSCNLRFRVALHVLRGEESETLEVLRRAVAAKEIGPQDVKEWPLFLPLRKTDEFDRVFGELFPNETLRDETPSAARRDPSAE
jgi:hypothetical protein